jgi:hypothetical protein
MALLIQDHPGVVNHRAWAEKNEARVAIFQFSLPLERDETASAE